MIRWSIAVALSAAACAPASEPGSAEILCRPVVETCPVQIEYNDYWREPPARLAPNEIVVEAVAVGGSAATRRFLSSESSGERERPCTQVEPVVVQRFRVTRVVSGEFRDPEFILLLSPRSCSGDFVALGLTQPPPDGEPAYLVVRPVDPPEGIHPTISARPGSDGALVEFTQQTMRHRVEFGPLP